MSNIIKVDTNDKYRTLLTEVLPYELPLWFNNFNMYQRLKNSNDLDAYSTISGLDYKQHRPIYIPLNYQISRGSNSSLRTISIMHPFAQLKVCDFYEEYDNLIEYYCTKSKHSLRYPYRVTTKFYGKTLKALKNSRFSQGVEGVDEERVVSSSYFKYKKYPFLYRFFESYDYHRLEKRFQSMLQVDISKCFPSIYTHSIGWAVKNKRLAKSKRDGGFDDTFDSLMQTTNYRETNGIIVGPEISRIFAEIILQKIDLNIVGRMRKSQYTLSKDYDFRRYVDDYFIFYRSEDIKTEFIKQLELSLLEYKLYLNQAKTSIITRPFATNISMAKHALKEIVQKCFESRNKSDEEGSESLAKLSRPDSEANKTISEIKMVLAQHKVEYVSISNYLFSAIENRMLSYLEEISAIEKDKKEEHHLNWFLVDLDVVFFVHAMDIRIRPTDRLGRLINNILEMVKSWPENYQEIIFKKIFDHVKQAINIFISNAKNMVGLETLNLLIILTKLPQSYQLNESKLKKYYKQLNKSSNTKDFYFRWVTFMLYIKNKGGYSTIRQSLEIKAEKYLLEHEDQFIDSEYFMFYFDYLACPYIDKKVRKTMMEKVKDLTLSKDKNFQIENFSKIVLNHDFIVSWSDEDYLNSCLEKREFIFPYN